MTAPPSGPPPIPNSRGHTLFALQAQRNAPDVAISTNQTQSSHRDLPPVLPPLRSAASFLPTFVTPQHVHPSPSVIHRRLPLGSSESYPHSDNTNVQLISIQARPEANYIKELPPSSALTKRSEKLEETDFPLEETPAIEEIEPTTHEGVMENYTTCEAFLEKAFDYLNSQDDDDDVVHQTPDPEQQYHSDSFDDDDDSVDTIDLPASIVKTDERNESKFLAVKFHPPQRNRSNSIDDDPGAAQIQSREVMKASRLFHLACHSINERDATLLSAIPWVATYAYRVIHLDCLSSLSRVIRNKKIASFKIELTHSGSGCCQYVRKKSNGLRKPGAVIFEWLTLVSKGNGRRRFCCSARRRCVNRKSDFDLIVSMQQRKSSKRTKKK